MKSNDKQRLERAVERFIAGDEEVFSEIYDLTNKYLYYTILKSVNIQEADDILQNTYVDIYKNMRSIREIGAFKTWAGIIAQNNVSHFYKKNAKFEICNEEELLTVEEDDAELLPEDAMENKETAALIQGIIQELPFAQKQTIVAFYYNQMSIAEIANAMDMPEGTVKTNLYRGKAKIKEGVLELEKKHGTKLRTVGIATVLFFLFGEEAAACELPKDGLRKVREYQKQLKIARRRNRSTVAAKVGITVVGLAVVGGILYGINRPIDSNLDNSSQINQSSEIAEETVENVASMEVAEVETDDSKIKTQVQVDLDGIANAYAKVMNEPSMELSDTFGLFDITGDGLPELFSGNGTEVITYWNNDRWELITEMVKLEWYYDAEQEKPLCYYVWDNEQGREEWLLYYNIDTNVENGFPWDWVSFGERISENIDLGKYTYVDIHANSKVENSNIETMKDTLAKWFEEQEDYIDNLQLVE